MLSDDDDKPLKRLFKPTAKKVKTSSSITNQEVQDENKRLKNDSKSVNESPKKGRKKKKKRGLGAKKGISSVNSGIENTETSTKVKENDKIQESQGTLAQIENDSSCESTKSTAQVESLNQQVQNEEEFSTSGKSNSESRAEEHPKRKRGRPSKTQGQTSPANNETLAKRKGNKRKRKKWTLKKKTKPMKKQKPKSRKKTKLAVVKSMISVEEFLPDLKPEAVKMTKRSTNESERAALISNNVIHEDPVFHCLQCNQTFAHFSKLSAHKANCSQEPSKPHLWKNSNESGKSYVEFPENDSSFSEFISGMTKLVPETTFNNMHGTIKDITSVEGQQYQSKTSMSAVDRVRLNLSGSWSTRDVWQSGGWEMMGQGQVSWHKYERPDLGRPFLQRLAKFPFDIQTKFKTIYDESVNSAKAKQGRYSKYSDMEKEEKVTPKKVFYLFYH